MSSSSIQRLRSEMRELPAADRAQLAHELVKSLDGPPDADVAKAWDSELQRRIREIEAGTANTIDREEFARRMRARLARI